jgi:integrase
MAEATTPKPRRPRGEGSIYTGADGRIRGAIVLVDPDTGRRYRRTVSGRSRGDVLRKLDKLRQESESGVNVKPGRPRTLATYVATWLPALRQRVRPATFIAYEHCVRLYVVPALGSVPLVQLTPTAVERMTAGIVARGLSPSTARSARTALRMILRDAERDGLVARNAAALARPPRVERHELRVLTADETRRLLDGTADDELGPLYAVAAMTGMRQGEVLGLRWQDVELGGPAPALTVRRALALDGTGGRSLAEPKTARSRRTLDLAPATVSALRRQKARQTEATLAAGDAWQDRDGLVFTDAVGRAHRPANVSHAFSDALARLGLPHVRFHDLRHGTASLLLAQGVPLKVVSETLGHSGIAITADTYAHLDREQRREAARAMERAIGGKS